MTERPGAPSAERASQRKRSSSRLTTIALLCVVAAMPAAAVACGSNEESKSFDTSTSTTSTGAGAGGGTSSSSGAGGDIFDDAGTGAPVAITPLDPILKVELPLQGQTMKFNCVDPNTGSPVAATWKLSNLEVGTIDATGLFTPNGDRPGKVTVTCEFNGDKAATELTVLIHAEDNQGGLTTSQIDILRGPPGLADPQWQFMYPYDGTVFPKGILAPEIHLTTGSAASNAYYVHVVLPDYEYEGFFNNAPTNTQLQMSQDAWEALTNAAKGATVEVHVSKIFNGAKYGPIYRTWTMANGTLHGTIYYNTYDSPLAGQTGAMMRIKGNSPTPEVLVGNCTVCHSVSADGSTAAAANHSGPGGTFDLSGGQLNPPLVWTDSERTAFSALYPKNGDVLVTNGAPSYSWPPNTPGTSSTWTSELYTKAGTLIPNSGIESYYAQSPVFSPDGKMLAFTDRSAVSPYPSVLALMDYDEATQKFSNYRVLHTPPPGRHYSWPAFTPDGKFVVYQDGTGDDLATWSGNTGKIFAVNTQTKEVVFLQNLNGDGYMPAGTRDENKNYEPTIAPIASGGYFWVMFTSRRTYGNKLQDDEYSTKRLWVSAFSVNAADGTDASHPGFYIAGQELTSGNSRGFWALDPCKNDGDGCVTGDECCNGFCNPKGDPPVYVCGPPDGSCSDEFESCDTSEDCCDPELECIGGKCTQLPPE